MESWIAGLVFPGGRKSGTPVRWAAWMMGILLLWAFPGSSLEIAVSIPPQEEIVRALVGENADIRVLIPPGASPESFSPGSRSLAGIISTDILMPIGLPFERALLDKLHRIAPDLKICRSVVSEDDSSDPHIWLDPRGAEEHAARLAKCLIRLDPARADEFKAGLEAYRKHMEDVEKQAAEILRPFAGRSVLVYHPAFGHFLARFGLEQIAIEKDGKAPSARGLAEIISHARTLGIHTIFIQPSIKSDAVRAVAEALDARIVELDPLAPDLAANILRISRTLARSFDEENGGR